MPGSILICTPCDIVVVPEEIIILKLPGTGDSIIMGQAKISSVPEIAANDTEAQLIHDLKKVLPQVRIWMGGPEASYDAVHLMDELPEVELIMQGEGPAHSGGPVLYRRRTEPF